MADDSSYREAKQAGQQAWPPQKHNIKFRSTREKFINTSDPKTCNYKQTMSTKRSEKLQTKLHFLLSLFFPAKLSDLSITTNTNESYTFKQIDIQFDYYWLFWTLNL